MKRLLIGLVFGLFFVGCSSLNALQVTPSATLETFSLPDLVFIGMRITPFDENGQCREYHIGITFMNQGSAAADNVTIVEISTGQVFTIGRLEPGQSMMLFLQTLTPTGQYAAVLDPQNIVAENNEANNNTSYIAPTPTPELICMLTANAHLTLTPAETITARVTETSFTRLSFDVLRDVVIYSPTWGEYQLADGVYYRTLPNPSESPENYSSRIQEPILFGDLNADGWEDAVIILNTHNGGNMPTFELAALLNRNGSASNVSTIPFGDQAAFDSGRIENGIIFLDTRILGLNDPLCCPSQVATQKYQLDGNLLIGIP